MSDVKKNNDITKANEQNLTLVEKLRLARQQPIAIEALLLDCSSSMNIHIEPGVSRHSALCEILEKVHFTGRVFWFDDSWGEIKKKPAKPPQPHGSTYLARLLEFIKSEGIKSCLIITDGEITDKQETRAAKSGLKIKVMFVGTKKPAFLDELASDGSATVEDLTQTKQLAEKIMLAISGPASEENIKKGPIQL